MNTSTSATANPQPANTKVFTSVGDHMLRNFRSAASLAIVGLAGSLTLALTLASCSPRTSEPKQAASVPVKDSTAQPTKQPTNSEPSTPQTAAAQPPASTESQPMDPLLAQWKDIPIDPKTGAVTLTDEQWQQRLSPDQYRILRQKGTERAFTGKLWDKGGPGEYRCAACGNLLFTGDDKFVSECGWPAFDKAIKGTIRYESDRTYGMLRTEVMCSRCDGHLGHVFNDGPTDTGTRYCINSVSIVHIPGTTSSKNMETEAITEAPAKK
jgi:peptide-methionine (R)-S-oxide reductase